MERIHARVPFAELYARNGLQFLPFNTIYQLAADPLADEAERMLLIPDLLGYWLTGEMVTERTNASTTGLLDVRTGEWDTDLMSRVGLRASLFTDLVDPGATIGKVTDEVGEQIGVPGLTVPPSARTTPRRPSSACRCRPTTRPTSRAAPGASSASSSMRRS